VCRPLGPLPDRLRLGETRGIGPWDPTYFKREATLEELRQDLLERDSSCDRFRSVLERLDPPRRQARAAEWERLRHEPIVQVEQLLPRVRYDRAIFLYVARLLDELACDDPRKSAYRLEVARRVLPPSTG
jgi:hypothetical protein